MPVKDYSDTYLILNFNILIMLNNYYQALTDLADKHTALQMQRFFKTGPGEYGEGDIFIGVSVPAQRTVAKDFYLKLSLQDYEQALQSSIHEHRLTCLFMLVNLFKAKNAHISQEEIYKLYLRNTKYINNWDLVDSSAHYIVGAYLENRDREILYKLADSDLLWDNRIAMISCFWFIRKNDFSDAFIIADLLLHHKHDLIHKAVGWMLREIGKKNYNAEYEYLTKTYNRMPRTMLRYAIEKFDETIRQDFLKGRIS